MAISEEINIIKFLKNPKVQLAIFTLLAVIMAIGFFGDPNISGAGTAASSSTAPADASAAAGATQVAAVSSKFLIATLSPMAAGFTLIPFIISIIGIGISCRRITKQNKEKDIHKAIKRYEVIGNEKEKLNREYEQEYDKLLQLKDGGGIALSDPSCSLHLHNIRSYIDDNSIQLHAHVPKSVGPTAPISYGDIMKLYDADSLVNKLRNIKNKIKAYEQVENLDLSVKMSNKGPMCGLRTTEEGIKNQIGRLSGVSGGIKAKIVSQLAAARYRKENHQP